MFPTLEDLFDEILKARQRVYEVAPPTPLEKLEIGDGEQELYIKREDVSPIHAYKWRGSYNRMRQLSTEELQKGVVCASAGNHAQGVALAAKKLGTKALIYMPRSTPLMKQDAVRSLGGDSVSVLLFGDSYDAACNEAIAIAEKEEKTFIHAYDDLQVIAGQGTLADEVVMSGKGPFDRVYLQIGGGGMAAGVACWLRRYYPDIEIVGVEGVHQASMAAAIEKGEPVSLDYLDVFCDGTAVKKAGDITSHFCRQLIDRFITVTNEEVCAGIQLLWDKHRLIPEPAGAMGLAAWLKEREEGVERKSLVIVCGSNMDFGQLAWVVRHAGVGSARRKYYRFFIEERQGSLLDLLNSFPDRINIIEFQHGLVAGEKAAPVIGIDAMPEGINALEEKLLRDNIAFEDATGDEDVEFRIIHYDATLLNFPVFVRIEFPERAGALGEFLNENCSEASLAYFNYGYTGERVGRALVGFDFQSEDAKQAFEERLGESSVLRHAAVLNAEAMARIV